MKINTTKLYRLNRNAREKVIINIGGARSSKSYSLAQLFLIYLVSSQKKLLILRKTLPSLKISTYRLFTDLMREYGYYRYCLHNKTERTISFGGGLVHFTGLDDPEKIKSTEWNYIWMEEANEFTWDDYVTLKTRLSAVSADGKPNRLYMSLNPVDSNGWIRQRLADNNDNDVRVIHSTYKDNPYLSEDYIRILRSLENEDESFYKIYSLGEWAEAKNMIYSNWKLTNISPDNYEEIIYGLDFGYNNPSCLLKIYICDDALYIEQLIYETKLTNSMLIERMRELDISSSDCIYADSAEPQRIKEISEYFNIHEADKNVNHGIDNVKRRTLKISDTSSDVISEIKMYKWKEDRNGNILDSPVKFKDHAMDALRYAVYTHFKKDRELKMVFV